MSMFRVEFKVDSKRLGEVLAIIHGLVTELDVSLLESVPHTKNKRRVRNGVSDILLEALQRASDHSLTSEQGKKLVAENGFKVDSFYNAKYALAKKGFIQYKNGKILLVKK